jgi:hypothetical protein
MTDNADLIARQLLQIKALEQKIKELDDIINEQKRIIEELRK